MAKRFMQITETTKRVTTVAGMERKRIFVSVYSRRSHERSDFMRSFPYLCNFKMGSFERYEIHAEQSSADTRYKI